MVSTKVSSFFKDASKAKAMALVHLTAALATGQSTAARFFISVKAEKDGAEP